MVVVISIVIYFEIISTCHHYVLAVMAMKQLITSFFECPLFNDQRLPFFRRTRCYHPLSLHALLSGKDNLSATDNDLLFIEVQEYWAFQIVWYFLLGMHLLSELTVDAKPNTQFNSFSLLILIFSSSFCPPPPLSHIFLSSIF